MLKYSINLIFLYAFPSAAPDFLKESGSLLVRSMNELAWKWNTSFELWLVFIAKMIIYSYFWTAASFSMHATSVLSSELFLLTNSSDAVCEMVLFYFFFLLGRENDCSVAKLWFSILGGRKGRRELGSSPWYRAGPGPPGCECFLPYWEGGRLVLALPSYIKYYINYIL